MAPQLVQRSMVGQAIRLPRRRRRIACATLPCVTSLKRLPRCELLHAPVLDLHHVDGAGAVHRYVVGEVELALDFAVRTQYSQKLTLQIQLDDAVIDAVAHVEA